MNDEFDRKFDRIENLDKDIDNLEAYSRRENIRIFGLPEDPNETPASIKEKLVNEVFRVASPDTAWSARDILRAHRIGKPDNDEDNPRPIIARFLHWDDKISVFQVWDDLRSRGIRIADDLTRRQRETLKRVKETSGRTGYFYKGELKYRENKQSVGEESRIFKRAKRQTDSEVAFDITDNIASPMEAVVNVDEGRSDDIADSENR